MSEIMQNSLSFNFLWFSVLWRSKKLKSNVISAARVSQENYYWVKKKKKKRNPSLSLGDHLQSLFKVAGKQILILHH